MDGNNGWMPYARYKERQTLHHKLMNGDSLKCANSPRILLSPEEQNCVAHQRHAYQSFTDDTHKTKQIISQSSAAKPSTLGSSTITLWMNGICIVGRHAIWLLANSYFISIYNANVKLHLVIPSLTHIRVIQSVRPTILSSVRSNWPDGI